MRAGHAHDRDDIHRRGPHTVSSSANSFTMPSLVTISTKPEPLGRPSFSNKNTSFTCAATHTHTHTHQSTHRRVHPPSPSIGCIQPETGSGPPRTSPHSAVSRSPICAAVSLNGRFRRNSCTDTPSVHAHANAQVNATHNPSFTAPTAYGNAVSRTSDVAYRKHNSTHTRSRPPQIATRSKNMCRETRNRVSGRVEDKGAP
jgi:hypothetical protein